MEDQPVVPFWDAELWAAVVYEARVNGQLLDFFRLNRFVDGRFFDENTGSEWSFEGSPSRGPWRALDSRRSRKLTCHFGLPGRPSSPTPF